MWLCVGESFCRYTFNKSFFPIYLVEKTEGNATSISSLDYNFISNHSSDILKVDEIYDLKINSANPFIILLVLTSFILRYYF